MKVSKELREGIDFIFDTIVFEVGTESSLSNLHSYRKDMHNLVRKAISEKPRWIDVTKQPPEVGERCWLIHEGNEIRQAVFEKKDHGGYALFRLTNGSSFIFRGHYLPLSALPEIPKKEGV